MRSCWRLKMILLLLSIAVLIGRGESLCEITRMDLSLSKREIFRGQKQPQLMDWHAKPLDEVPDVRGIPQISTFTGPARLNCTHHNTEKLTYALKVDHNGQIKDVDSIGCLEKTTEALRKSIYYHAKGESARSVLPNHFNVDFFCAVPIDRACGNPFAGKEPCDKHSKFHCPTYTEGTNEGVAKLECAGNKWRVNGNNQIITDKPICKRKDAKSDPEFFVKTSFGREVRVDGESTRCYKNVEDADPVPPPAPRRPSHGSNTGESAPVLTPFIIAMLVVVPMLCCAGIGITVCVCVEMRNNKRRAQHFANMYPPYGQSTGGQPSGWYPKQPMSGPEAPPTYETGWSPRQSEASQPLQTREEPANDDSAAV